MDAGIRMGQGLLKAEAMRRRSRRAGGGRRRPATSAAAARSAGARQRRGQGADRDAARSSAAGKGATAASVPAGKPVDAAEFNACAPRNQSPAAEAQTQSEAMLLNQAVPADALAPLLLVDTNCPFRASTARHFENELTNSFPLPLSQYPRNAVVYSHKEASSGRLVVQHARVAPVVSPAADVAADEADP